MRSRPIKWTPGMTTTLLSTIRDDKDYREALFPRDEDIYPKLAGWEASRDLCFRLLPNDWLEDREKAGLVRREEMGGGGWRWCATAQWTSKDQDPVKAKVNQLKAWMAESKLEKMGINLEWSTREEIPVEVRGKFDKHPYYFLLRQLVRGESLPANGPGRVHAQRAFTRPAEPPILGQHLVAVEMGPGAEPSAKERKGKRRSEAYDPEVHREPGLPCLDGEGSSNTTRRDGASSATSESAPPSAKRRRTSRDSSTRQGAEKGSGQTPHEAIVIDDESASGEWEAGDGDVRAEVESVDALEASLDEPKIGGATGQQSCPERQPPSWVSLPSQEGSSQESSEDESGESSEDESDESSEDESDESSEDEDELDSDDDEKTELSEQQKETSAYDPARVLYSQYLTSLTRHPNIAKGLSKAASDAKRRDIIVSAAVYRLLQFYSARRVRNDLPDLSTWRILLQGRVASDMARLKQLLVKCEVTVCGNLKKLRTKQNFAASFMVVGEDDGYRDHFYAGKGVKIFRMGVLQLLARIDQQYRIKHHLQTEKKSLTWQSTG